MDNSKSVPIWASLTTLFLLASLSLNIFASSTSSDFVDVSPPGLPRSEGHIQLNRVSHSKVVYKFEHSVPHMSAVELYDAPNMDVDYFDLHHDSPFPGMDRFIGSYMYWMSRISCYSSSILEAVGDDGTVLAELSDKDGHIIFKYAIHLDECDAMDWEKWVDIVRKQQ